jgi:predicted phage terminase large subunit-like protein
MGSAEFQAQYLQEPIPPSGNMIDWSWFQFYDEPPDWEFGDEIVMSWDTALSASELADYSACVVMQIRGETAWILDVVRGRYDYPTLRRKAIELHEHWSKLGPYRLIIENKGSGMSLIQDLHDQHIHPISAKVEGDKVMRMHAQTARIESGAVLLPRRAPWLADFRKEIMMFPDGRYDDQVDALAHGLDHAFNRRVPVGRTGRYRVMIYKKQRRYR